MFRNKTKKNNESKTTTSTEIARQDPRTKVRSTVMQTQTTNTTVQNATIFNDRANTVTYQTITQTVTHHQVGGITETKTRHTATPEELEAFMASLDLGNGKKEKEQNQNTPVTRLISKYESPNKTSSATKKTNVPSAGPKDKKNSSAYTRTPTSSSSTPPKLQLFHTEETTVTQNRGCSLTSNVQEQRFKLNLNRGAPYKSATTSKVATDEPYSSKRGLVPISSNSSTYTSPYTKRTVIATDAKPFVMSQNISNFKPSASLRESTTQLPQPNLRTYPVIQNGLKPSATTSSLPTTGSYVPTASRLNSSPSLPTIRNSAPNKPKCKLKPGLMYIFNNEEFDDRKNEYRVGSSADVKALRDTFEAFKMKVEVFKNPTVKDIRTVVKNIETKDFTNRSCLVIVILSHGHRFERVLAKNEPYTIDDDVLFPILRNRTLIDKPKIFFIQACKGSMEIGGLHKDSQQPHGAPTEVLKCYSTFEGYVSYRTEQGSIFVQKLCENIKRDGNTKSVDEIMKEVTRSVKIISNQKQIPTVTSTMTKPLIFGDYI